MSSELLSWIRSVLCATDIDMLSSTQSGIGQVITHLQCIYLQIKFNATKKKYKELWKYHRLPNIVGGVVV